LQKLSKTNIIIDLAKGIIMITKTDQIWHG